MKRSNFLKVVALAGCSLPINLTAMSLADEIMKRKIPSSGELLPSVGLGTWQSFDVGDNQAAREPLKEVLQALISNGGTVIDSSPMYGSSERVIGELSEDMGITSQLFCATKVWTSGQKSGMRKMDRSIDLMRKQPLDLMQVHNLQDWQTHLKTLVDWKEQGKIRYTGITHYVESAYSKMENIMKNYPIDFIQLNYSLATRTAEKSILPLALEKGIAVLVNRPYEGGSLFRSVKTKKIPDWAKELDINSWGQFFLKYILSNPAVTCVIPGTSKPHHMLDNMGAGFGPLPDNMQRQSMIDYMQS